ncbi:HEAT repeat domain-containing protein [Actimicrobium sp. CCC2.4]|uniref:HEAT repeat domain-containing protein n=1 Tax=Actimicrobium sp. CCC2.4 TaxID=3048606 RepID=UPI002AC8FB0C|nr:HEAT repeat domain-containing protein [Actimicrobium sp. CCC2.4]MEB0133717.1 HEAT repeat domain-containing protein [Actimicrobium sp. CCC2.4]WPX31264.1 HEAT repeat domain-containing protein [Actimicrobium sp. CCC2.4]
MAFIKKSTDAASTGADRVAERDFAGLIAQLDDADPATRRWAARDLLVFPAATAALVARLKREDDRSVREFILTSLTRLGDEIAVAGLVEWLRSEDAVMRNEAIEAMKALPDEVAPIMGGLLSDPDPDVRIMAVNVLESLRHPHVEDWLIDVIDNDSVINVCGTAVDLLGEVGSPAARASLLRLRERFPAEPYIRFATDLALKRIGEA